MDDITGVKGIVEKIIDVLGLEVIGAFWRAKSDSIKKINEMKTNNELEIKNAIINNSELTPQQKLQLNAMLGTGYKKFIRQMSVLGIAIDNMDEKCSKDNLDEDWLLDFFDKVSNISNEEIKKIWGKLLAGAASDKNICSKTLLNALFLMSTDEIKDFNNLIRFCVSEVGCGNNSSSISAYPIIYFAKNVKNYEMSRISRIQLNKLATLGLIDVDYKKEFIFSQQRMRLIYNNKIVELASKEKIYIGNVIFTYDGFLLYEMAEKIFNNRILEYNIEIWKKRGYEVHVGKYFYR